VEWSGRHSTLEGEEEWRDPPGEAEEA